MCIKEVLVVERDVPDNAHSVCDDAELERIAEMPVDGYGELSEIQKEDIKTLAGNYGFDPSWGLFENIEIENLNMEFTIGEEIEFTDFNNISFGGNSYQVIEICHYEREHYKELNLRPESLRRIGAKGAIEMRCKEKESDSDYFLIIVNANRDVFFVPLIELRREDNGYNNEKMFFVNFPVLFYVLLYRLFKRR